MALINHTNMIPIHRIANSGFGNHPMKLATAWVYLQRWTKGGRNREKKEITKFNAHRLLATALFMVEWASGSIHQDEIDYYAQVLSLRDGEELTELAETFLSDIGHRQNKNRLVVKEDRVCAIL